MEILTARQRGIVANRATHASSHKVPVLEVDLMPGDYAPIEGGC